MLSISDSLTNPNQGFLLSALAENDIACDVLRCHC